MADVRPRRLDPPLELGRDHALGPPLAEMTLVEYGSYACGQCHTVHEIVEGLRSELGDRLRYVFRHLPLPGNDMALRAAELAEYAELTAGRFWEVHDALMETGPSFSDEDLAAIASRFGLPPFDSSEPADVAARRAAERRVREDSASAQRGGARLTPTFFIGDRRYEGLWDASSLSDALLGSLGHRFHAATLYFLDWGPSSGLLLGLASLVAIALANTGLGAAFETLWTTSLSLGFGRRGFAMPLVDWVNHGLLTIFFLVVGLEIKREMTVGHVATVRKAALPVLAAAGGILLPALIYLALAPSGPLRQGWAIPIATDTAFAVAVIVLLGSRVPVELRVFLTATVIIDDLVAIVVIALFYTGELGAGALAAAAAVTAGMVALNRWNVYAPLPYALLGIVLWVLLHEGGLHATLAGVILAVVTPTRPPANLRALTMQAEQIIAEERRRAGATVMRPGPSDRGLRALDAIHRRIESPADKLLRTVEPWSSYAVLPIFALANAGVAWSLDVFEENGRMMLAIAAGLVLGKPVGILLAARLAVRSGVAVKPEAYTWGQLGGAAALAGIGFTMSLFIAGQAFNDPRDYAAAKIAIFLASLLAGGLGAILLATSKGETFR